MLDDKGWDGRVMEANTSGLNVIDLWEARMF